MRFLRIWGQAQPKPIYGRNILCFSAVAGMIRTLRMAINDPANISVVQPLRLRSRARPQRQAKSQNQTQKGRAKQTIPRPNPQCLTPLTLSSGREVQLRPISTFQGRGQRSRSIGTKNQEIGRKSQARRRGLSDKSLVPKARAGEEETGGTRRERCPFSLPRLGFPGGISLVMPGKARREKTRPMSF